MRTKSSTVTFRHPFTLSGFTEPHPPGSFEVRVSQERLKTSFEAWRQVATTIMLGEEDRTIAWPVRAPELRDALIADEAQSE
jgi:hypothetical protein